MGPQPLSDGPADANDSGSHEGIYTPAFTMSFGGRAFEGPWRNYVLYAARIRGKHRVWAVYGHHTWWPTMMVELKSDGSATPTYFQAGGIYSIDCWSTESHDYVVAGGVSNPFARASVAVIDLDGRPTASPQAGAPTQFRCDSCPPQGPAFFALLPRTDVNEAGDVPYNRVSTVRAIGPECVIETLEYGVNGTPGGVVDQLLTNFTFRGAAPNDGYGKLHQRLEGEGRLGHSAAACPVRGPASIRASIAGSGWADVSCPWEGSPPGG